MNNSFDDAIKNLREALVVQQEVAAREQAKLASMTQALQQLTNPNVVLVTDVGRRDYEHMGIVEAARAWLNEVGGAHRTEDIAKALLERGIKTKSKRMTPNVYATLRNSEEFIRVGDRWKLKREK